MKFKDRLTNPRDLDGALISDDEQKDVVLSNANNLEYWGTIQVGTPGQNFQVLFDTTSADFWLPSVNCASANCLPHDLYNSTASNSYVANGAAFSLSTGFGAASGIISQDKVTIDGTSIMAQAFGEATTYPISVRSGLLYT